MGQYGMNDHFIPNTMGKTISIDIQPYRMYTGTLTKITPRQVTVSEFDATKGHCRITYEVFDCEVTVTEGREVRALFGGVPQGSHVIPAGTVQHVTLNYGQLFKGAHQEETVIIVRCG